MWPSDELIYNMLDQRRFIIIFKRILLIWLAAQKKEDDACEIIMEKSEISNTVRRWIDFSNEEKKLRWIWKREE